MYSGLCFQAGGGNNFDSNYVSSYGFGKKKKKKKILQNKAKLEQIQNYSASAFDWGLEANQEMSTITISTAKLQSRISNLEGNIRFMGIFLVKTKYSRTELFFTDVKSGC